MRDLKFDWGVIPYPKYDESQEKYHTRASSGMEVFQIPVTSSGREDVGAVLEALSSEGYKSLTPAYYETALKVKYTNGDKTSEMLDLIKDSASIEFALVFASAVGAPTDQFKNAVGNSSNKGGWASTVASLKPKTVGLLEGYVGGNRGEQLNYPNIKNGAVVFAAAPSVFLCVMTSPTAIGIRCASGLS